VSHHTETILAIIRICVHRHRPSHTVYTRHAASTSCPCSCSAGNFSVRTNSTRLTLTHHPDNSEMDQPSIAELLTPCFSDDDAFMIPLHSTVIDESTEVAFDSIHSSQFIFSCAVLRVTHNQRISNVVAACI